MRLRLLRRIDDPLLLPMPLPERRGPEAADLPTLRPEPLLPRQARYSRGDAGREVGEEETLMVSTERLDELIRVCEAILRGEIRGSAAYRNLIITPEEVIDLCRDAKRWREHVRPPRNCDHRLDR